MRRSKVRSLALPIALLSLLLPGRGHAGGTRSFVVDTSEAFEKGKLVGVASHATGKLTRAASSERTAVEGAPVAYASAVGPDGTIYVATGNEGAIYRVTDAGAKLFADTPAALVTSLLWVGETLYAATLPGGRVYAVARDGKAREHAALPGADLVWALAYAPHQQRLYAATGPEGKLFALDASGRAQVVHDDAAEHLLCLDVDGEGRVYAGTSNGARLVRVSGREVRVLYDFPGQELTVLDVGRGFIAAASNDFPAPPSPSGDTKDLGAAARAKRLKPGKGSVYALGYDGQIAELAQFAESHVSALAIDGDDAVQIGLAHEGRIVRVTRAGERALWADVDERQIASIHLEAPAPHFVSSDGVAVHRVRAPKQEGTWTSATLDAKAPARFGELSLRASGPVRISTRSGNTEVPDDSWSAWSTESAGSGPIKSPPARFLQVRVTLSEAAELYAIEAYYLPQNLPPRLRNVRQKTRASEATGRNPMTALPLTWDIDNPDEDKLRYRLEVRREGQTAWRSLLREHEPLEQAEYNWDVRTVPDGHYRVRVSASDEPANPAPYATNVSAVSAPLLVDTRAPELRDLRFAEGKLTGTASDALGPIANLELSIDSGLYRPFYPVDDLLDRPEERFSVAIEGLTPGVHTLSVRATDAAHNATSAALEVSVAAH